MGLMYKMMDLSYSTPNPTKHVYVDARRNNMVSIKLELTTEELTDTLEGIGTLIDRLDALEVNCTEFDDLNELYIQMMRHLKNDRNSNGSIQTV